MPYIGTSPSNGVRRVHTYTATASQTTFTGASSEGVTLSYADTNYIDVFQNGVLLGSADYTSTSGTSVVLAQGASADDLIVIVVYDVFSVADTVSKTNGGSFDSAVTFSSDVTIGDASASDKKILFDGNAQDFHIGLDDSSDSLTLGLGSALGTTPYMVIDANGHINMPSQSCFMADVGSQQANISEGSNIDVQFSNERFDLNGDFNNSNYTFTAPVTGKYQANVVVRFSHLSQGAAYYYLELNTSNDNYYNIFDPDFGQDNTFWTITFASLIDMDAGDTAKVRVLQEASGTGGQTDIEDTSFFSIYLVA